MPNYRDSTLYKLLPHWWTKSGSEGEKVAYSWGWMYDAYIERLRQGLNARFPQRTQSEQALAAIGRDRLIFRGRNEPAARYARRLREWRYPGGHRTRGNPFALLRQIRTYFSDLENLKVRTVDVHGNWYTIHENGEETHTWNEADWYWDGDDIPPTPRWGRFWVIIYGGSAIVEQPVLGEDTGLWGDALGTDGYTIGQTNVTPEDVTAIRSLMRGSHGAWKPAGTLGQWVIIALDPETFIPGSTFDTQTDTPWTNWSETNPDTGVQFETRMINARYWKI